jgi:hypothetical protein
MPLLSRRVRGFPGPLLALTLIFCVGLSQLCAGEAAAARHSFALAAGVAEVTLDAFSEQADISLVYPLDDVRGVTTNPVHGHLAIREALERLVAGTALEVRQDGRTGAYVIKRARSGTARSDTSRVPDSGKTASTENSSQANMTRKNPLAFVAALLGFA